MSILNQADSKKWIKFLSLWAILPAIATIALVVTLSNVMNTYGAGPIDAAMIAGVAKNQLPIRALGLSQIMLWLSIGGLLIGFASLFKESAPIRSTLVKASGYGMGISAIGGILHLTATIDLAKRYETAGTDKEMILSIYTTVGQLIEAHFYSGELLSGIGFLLLFSISLRVTEIPKWLSGWMGVSGLYSVVLLLLRSLGVPVPFITVPIYVIFFAFALYLAIALVMRKRMKLFST